MEPRQALFLKGRKNASGKTSGVCSLLQLIPKRKKGGAEPSQICQSNHCTAQERVNERTKGKVRNIIRKIPSSKKSAVEIKYSPLICTFLYVCTN